MAATRRRMSVAMLSVVAILLLMATGNAGEPIAANGRSVTTSGDMPCKGRDFIDGINPEVAVDEDQYYTVVWFALPYTPGLSYVIERIEFIHGEGTGTVTIQVRSDNGGMPSNDVLTEGTHELEFPVGFQGADMPPFVLTAGRPYWIVLAAIPGSQASGGQHGDGDEIAYYYGHDGVSWNGTAPTEVWIARFFGEEIVPVESATWGGVKAIYR